LSVLFKVDPAEEKGVPHLSLPSRGDLCLLLSSHAPELLLLLFENCTPSSPFLVPFIYGRMEEERVMMEDLCVGAGGIQ
jgi:hypothetical protein